MVDLIHSISELCLSVKMTLCFPFLFRHPLFPLLTLLFEKCEQATQGSECITSASFDVDIENFVHQQEQEHKPFFSDDPELDNLVMVLPGPVSHGVLNILKGR